MKSKVASLSLWLLILILVASVALVGCGGTPEPEEPAEEVAAPTEAPAEEAAAPTDAPAEEAAGPVVNRAGMELPADAAPLDQQVLRLPRTEFSWLGWDYTAYDFTAGPTWGIHDSCVRPDKEFQPQPSGCESWEVSDDGLTWTFHLPEDKVWSDGEPVTAEDLSLIHI